MSASGTTTAAAKTQAGTCTGLTADDRPVRRHGLVCDSHAWRAMVLIMQPIPASRSAADGTGSPPRTTVSVVCRVGDSRKPRNRRVPGTSTRERHPGSRSGVRHGGVRSPRRVIRLAYGMLFAPPLMTLS